jgi:hypothetical protein
MSEFRPAKRRVKVSVGNSVRIRRALKCHPAVLVFPGWESEEHRLQGLTIS